MGRYSSIRRGRRSWRRRPKGALRTSSAQSFPISSTAGDVPAGRHARSGSKYVLNVNGRVALSHTRTHNPLFPCRFCSFGSKYEHAARAPRTPRHNSPVSCPCIFFLCDSHRLLVKPELQKKNAMLGLRCPLCPVNNTYIHRGTSLSGWEALPLFWSLDTLHVTRYIQMSGSRGFRPTRAIHATATAAGFIYKPFERSARARYCLKNGKYWSS